MLKKQKMKRNLTAALAAVMTAGAGIAAYGGEWKQDQTGWYYQNDDGSFQADGWFTDSNGKSYYFNSQGYMLSNTATPDGQRVGADGALIPAVRSLPSAKGDLYCSGLRQTLDSMLLYPQETTGYEDLDLLLEQIFAQIITPDMDTHDKLKACYDYLITHTVYGQNSYTGGTYRYAYGTLAEGIGVCDDYSAAFAVMARKIGVPVYTASGSTHKSNGQFTPHTWCQLDYNGVTYIFDPQVEDVIANSRGGAIMYIRFGGATAQLADKYRFEFIMDDFSSVPEKKSDSGQDEGIWTSGGQDNLTEEELWDLLWPMLSE